MNILKGVNKIYNIIFILLVFNLGNAFAQVKPLTLREAECMAIANAPELQRFHAISKALDEQAVANGQLEDPKLMVGAINVPTNTFSFTQDDMTMISVGLEQSFPKGHSLSIKAQQTRALAIAEQRKAQEKIISLVQNVRKTWLDLYYWEQTARVIRNNRALFTYLLKSVRSQYSVGKNNLSNVLQVQLELSRLNDQLAQTQQQIDVLRAELGRWIGQDQANRPLAGALPRWKNPPPFSIMKIRLEQHPLLKIDAANIDAAHEEVALAREQFKPGFTADVSYGIRQGNMIGMNGLPRSRSDMITAQVAMDLPVFAKNRQSRLQASTHQLEVTELDQQVHYRDLLKELTAQYAIWQRLSQRENLYSQQLMPEARQNAKAALLGYRSATNDLATVLRAYTNEKNIRLEQLQIKIEREKVKISLLYLEGLTR